jgi:general secretion pathway protein C
MFILLAGLLLMRGVNAFVEAQLVPLPTGKSKAAGPVKGPVMSPVLVLEKIAKLTGLPVPKPDVEVKETVPTVDLSAAPVRSPLRVKLLGTGVNENADWSFASVQDIVTLKTGTYMVHNTIQGAEVLEIERLRVIVLNNNRREFIDGTPGDGTAVAAAPAPSVAPLKASGDGAPPSVALGAGVKQLAENDYEIPRAEIDKTLSNLNDVAMQARIVPAFKDGVSQGFKLFSIRPDSIYTKIGIQNGDVIKRINGYDLNSPEKALEIYSKLKEAGRIDIEVERNGAAVRKTYNVR